MPDTRRGFVFGLVAYAIWGLFPLYWPLLDPTPAIQILAHRMLWSLVFIGALLAARRRWAFIGEFRHDVQAARLTRACRTADQRQLGCLHLGSQCRPRRRVFVGLLHHPAGQHRARRSRLQGAPATHAMDCRHGGCRGGTGDRRRVRAGAVDRALARRELRRLRPGQEDRPHTRPREPRRRDLGDGTARDCVSPVCERTGVRIVRPRLGWAWICCSSRRAS